MTKMIFNFNSFTPYDWFNLLSNDTPTEKGSTYIYQVNANSDFVCKKDDSREAIEENLVAYEKGIYLLRTEMDDKDLVTLKEKYKVTKLNFLDIVCISDVCINYLTKMEQPKKEEYSEAGIGNLTSKVNFCTVNIEGLENLQKKIKVKYFENGVKAAVRSIFSALYNFFVKYRLIRSGIESAIYWPGNSCTYADKVIANYHHIIKEIHKKEVPIALEISKKHLSEHLDISVDELNKLDLSEIKKRYYRFSLENHPDKIKGDAKKEEKFKNINLVWKDYQDLVALEVK